MAMYLFLFACRGPTANKNQNSDYRYSAAALNKPRGNESTKDKGSDQKKNGNESTHVPFSFLSNERWMVLSLSAAEQAQDEQADKDLDHGCGPLS